MIICDIIIIIIIIKMMMMLMMLMIDNDNDDGNDFDIYSLDQTPTSYTASVRLHGWLGWTVCREILGRAV